MLLIVYILFVLATVVVGALLAWTRIRRLRIRVVIQTLASIVSQNLPLVAALRAAAPGEGAALRRVFARLADRLEAGDELSTALRATMLSCPGDVIGALQGAERGGTLPTILQNLASEGRRAAHLQPAQQPMAAYLLVLLFFVPLVLAFAALKVFPTYVVIFRDFECELPQITVTLSDVLSRLHTHWELTFLVALALIIAIVQAFIVRWFCPRVPDRRQLPYAVWDALVWHLPGVRQVAAHRALVRQLPVLLAAVRTRQDLADGAQQAACVAVNRYARLRFADWADALRAGTEPRAAARAVGFPAALVRALATARSAEELAIQLEFLLAYYRGLAIRWEHMLIGIVGPLLVVFWGLVVGYLVLAFFLPLVGLIVATEQAIS